MLSLRRQSPLFHLREQTPSGLPPPGRSPLLSSSSSSPTLPRIFPRTCRWCKRNLGKRSLAVFAIHTCMFDIRKRKLYSGFIPYLAHLCGQNFLSFKIVFSSQDLPPARPVFCVCGRGFAFASAVSASAIDMLLRA